MGEAGQECDPHLSGYLEGEAWRFRKEAQVGREHRVWVRGLLLRRGAGVITQAHGEGGPAAHLPDRRGTGVWSQSQPAAIFPWADNTKSSS